MIRLVRFIALISTLITAAASSLSAAPLQFGPSTRLSQFRTGAPGDDQAIRVDPAGSGFVAYWAHRHEFRSVAITGNPPRPDPATVHTAAAVPAGFQACNETHCANAFTTVDNLFVIEVVSRADGTRVRVEHSFLNPGAIASDPNGFAVVDSLAGHFFRVDNSGHLTADVALPAPPASSRFNAGALAFNGDTYALFYSVDSSAIAARKVGLDGTIVSATTVLSTNMQPSRAAWNGSEYLLALEKPGVFSPIPEAITQTDLYALRVGPDFRPLDPQPFVLSTGGANRPAGVAANGGLFYVLWTHNHDSLMSAIPHKSVIEGAAIAATGEVLTHDVLSLGPLPQETPTVGQSASTALVTWKETDMRTQISSLRYALVDRRSHLTLAEGELDSAGEIETGDVVALGGDFLVVWRRDTLQPFSPVAARAVIIRQNTTVQDVAQLDWAFIHAAANGDHWLIAGATTTSQLQTIVIGRDGHAADPVAVMAGTFVGGLASDGNRFLMTAFWLVLLDADGKLITLQQSDSADDVDFTGGYYATLAFASSSQVLEIYDREARRLTATAVAPLAFFIPPVLTHVGPWFVVLYTDVNNATYMTVVAADGTLIARDVPAPRGAIAKSGTSTSTAILIQPDAGGGAFAEDALFVSDVSLDASQRRRAARH